MSARRRNLWSDYRWRESGWTRVRAMLSLGTAFGLSAMGTMAFWVDNATATSGTFSVASLSLQINDTSDYTAWALEAPGMMPGSTAASQLVVQNKGGEVFSYTAKANAIGDSLLAPNITITAHQNATSNGTTCTEGSEIGSSSLTVGTANNLITTGRELNPGASEALCFEVRLSQGVSKNASNTSVQAIVELTATA